MVDDLPPYLSSLISLWMILISPPSLPLPAVRGPCSSSSAITATLPFFPHFPSSSPPMHRSPYNTSPPHLPSSQQPPPPTVPTASHPYYIPNHPSGVLFAHPTPTQPPPSTTYPVHLPAASTIPRYGSYPTSSSTFLSTQAYSTYTASSLPSSPSSSPSQPLMQPPPQVPPHHLQPMQPSYWASTSPQLSSASAPNVVYDVSAMGGAYANHSPTPLYQPQPQPQLLHQHPHPQSQPHYHPGPAQPYAVGLVPSPSHRLQSAPPQFYPSYSSSAPVPPPTGYYYHAAAPVDYSSVMTSPANGPPTMWVPSSPSSTSSTPTHHPTTPPLAPLPATCLASEYHSIIECGGIDPSTGRRRLTHYVDYFGKEVEFYTATADPTRSTLYRVSTLAAKIECATNKVGMYLARRKTSGGGIYQAVGFLYKPSGRVGLKAGGYFLSLGACREFEAHFAPTVLDEVRTTHSRDSDQSNSSSERSLTDMDLQGTSSE